MATVISLSNQKGGVGKSATAANLGIGLARQGKKVLLIDSDLQASLTVSLGFQKPDELPVIKAALDSDAAIEMQIAAQEQTANPAPEKPAAAREQNSGANAPKTECNGTGREG